MASVSKRRWTHKGEPREAWIVRYRDQDGTHRQETFSKKKEADAFRSKVEVDIRAGAHLAKSEKLKVNEVVEAWLRYQEQRWRSGEIGKGRYLTVCGHMNTHVRPSIGRRLWADLTAFDIETWARELMQPGYRGRKEGLSPWSVKALMAEMVMIEGFALKRRMQIKPIMADARRALGSLKGKAIRVITKDELRRVMEEIERPRNGVSPRGRQMLRCYVTLAAFCGLRLGEINGLRVANIDFDRSVIRVRNSITRWGELKGPKTKAGNRDVPLPAALGDFLRVWLRDFSIENKLGLAFTTGTGEVMVQIDWSRRWQNLVRWAGLNDADPESVHFHALRHFAASYMIAQQIPLPDVARLLGHETFDTTLQVYAHPLLEMDRHQAVLDQLSTDMSVRTYRGNSRRAARMDASEERQEARRIAQGAGIDA